MFFILLFKLRNFYLPGESIADTSTSSPDLPGPISPATVKMEISRISPTSGLLSKSSDNRWMLDTFCNKYRLYGNHFAVSVIRISGCPPNNVDNLPLEKILLHPLLFVRIASAFWWNTFYPGSTLILRLLENIASILTKPSFCSKMCNRGTLAGYWEPDLARDKKFQAPTSKKKFMCSVHLWCSQPYQFTDIKDAEDQCRHKYHCYMQTTMCYLQVTMVFFLFIKSWNVDTL